MEACKKLLEVCPVLNIKCAIKFLQFLFFGLNLFYGVVGTLFITMFFFVNWVSNTYFPFLGWDVINLSIIFIVIGMIMFVVSLFGSIVAVKESTLLANVYAGIVLFLLVVELNAAITLFIMLGNIGPKIEMNMHKNLNNHTLQDHSYVMERWNKMQQNLECCGVNSPKDWAPLHVYGATVYDDNNDGYAPYDTYTVPFSCCRSFRPEKNQSRVYCDDLHDWGCSHALDRRCSGYVLPIVGVTTGVTMIMQLAGCIIAYILAKVIRRSKTSEEMKKQELQHLVYEKLNSSQEHREDAVIMSDN